MSYVLRANTEGIISEFLLSKDSETTLVLLDGLPSNVSCKRDVMQRLLQIGVSSVAPRYKGTWESEGTFLDHNPADDIKRIISTIREGEFMDLYNHIPYKLPHKKIIIVGVSFGGIVALDCLRDLGINDKCILFSPLCDVVKFSHDLMEIRDFVKEGFGRAYNFSLKDWDDMVNGKLFETDYSMIREGSNKISLIYDENDKSILASDLLKFCGETNIKNIKKLNGYGHLSYSKWDDNIYDIISKII